MMRNDVDYIDETTLERPHLLVVIDTEEEFDWHRPVSSDSTGTEHLSALPSWQKYFVESGVKPCYVVDYPVSQDKKAMQLLSLYHNDGSAEIGAHCHPWVNPPIEEKICAMNSYPGNLPELLEFAKIQTLTEEIERQIEAPLKSYKSGRYGSGPNTQDILLQLGYEIDLSVCPAFDARMDGGPDYRFEKTQSFIYTSQENKKLTHFPLSSDFVGWGGVIKPHIDPLARKLERLRIPGILARSGFSDRLKLSPEGYTSNEHIKLANSLIKKGNRILSWTLHSSSFAPGYSPYVRTENDLNEFKAKFDLFFDYFFNTLGGVAVTPAQLKKELTL